MKVLLVDNHRLFLQGLQAVLRSGGIHVAGLALNGAEAVAHAKSLHPDVVILNISGKSRNNLATVRRIRNKIPTASIIVFADNEENLRAAEGGGASGYLLSEIKSGLLIEKLHEIETGGEKR
ncbi:MAG: response regulator [Dehalococcoidia bacterium]|nr:response regulator [Dehalococcoidia bacterium]MDD5494008.1 response regulator [Dehalococcoidia bacterium]